MRGLADWDVCPGRARSLGGSDWDPSSDHFGEFTLARTCSLPLRAQRDNLRIATTLRPCDVALLLGPKPRGPLFVSEIKVSPLFFAVFAVAPRLQGWSQLAEEEGSGSGAPLAIG